VGHFCDYGFAYFFCLRRHDQLLFAKKKKAKVKSICNLNFLESQMSKLQITNSFKKNIFEKGSKLKMSKVKIKKKNVQIVIGFLFSESISRV